MIASICLTQSATSWLTSQRTTEQECRLVSKAASRIVGGIRKARAFARGEVSEGFVAHVPDTIDVKAIRAKLGLSQHAFALRFGFSAAAVRDWEQGRREPESAARVLLMVIDDAPQVVERVLQKLSVKAGRQTSHAPGLTDELGNGKPPGHEATNLFPDRAALAQVCQHHHIRRLSLFGSVLKGTAHPDSDVDLLVEFEPGHVPGMLTIAGIEEELSAQLGGRRVDLRTAQDLSPHFREGVVSSAKVQYAA
jgi:predicted nucleotidyltransferase/DNA-binding transcriptional regulator YiaG